MRVIGGKRSHLRRQVSGQCGGIAWMADEEDSTDAVQSRSLRGKFVAVGCEDRDIHTLRRQFLSTANAFGGARIEYLTVVIGNNEYSRHLEQPPSPEFSNELGRVLNDNAFTALRGRVRILRSKLPTHLDAEFVERHDR